MSDDFDHDPRHGLFVRVASVVGDLDSPFYDEERDRDVWNEASAVGFQVLLWGLPLVAAASLWVLGAKALLPTGLVLALWVAAGAVVLVYARGFGVDPNARTPLVAGRRAMLLTVLGLLGTGLVRGALDLEVAGNSPATSLLRGLGQGMAVTAAVLSLMIFLLLVRERLRSRANRADRGRG